MLLDASKNCVYGAYKEPGKMYMCNNPIEGNEYYVLDPKIGNRDCMLGLPNAQRIYKYNYATRPVKVDGGVAYKPAYCPETRHGQCSVDDAVDCKSIANYDDIIEDGCNNLGYRTRAYTGPRQNDMLPPGCTETKYEICNKNEISPCSVSKEWDTSDCGITGKKYKRIYDKNTRAVCADLVEEETLCTEDEIASKCNFIDRDVSQCCGTTSPVVRLKSRAEKGTACAARIQLAPCFPWESGLCMDLAKLQSQQP